MTRVRVQQDRTIDPSPRSGSDGFGLLRQPQTVLFGPGQIAAVAGTAAELGRHVLVCTDQRLGGSAVLSTMLEAMRSRQLKVEVFAETEVELPVSCVTESLRRLSGAAVDCIIGIGGGSCLDMAKLMGLLLTHGGTPGDYYGEFRVPGPILPVIAVPTTAGTGSESSPVAVVTDTDRGSKLGISSPHLIPKVAICDPELTYSCPPSLTAASGIDAVSHLIESYTAIQRDATPELAANRIFVGKSRFTDAIALLGLEALGRGLVQSFRFPVDARARRETMAGALAGGMALGTAGTAAAHALQYPIGALTRTPHGVGIGVLLPYVMRYNLSARIPEFAAIGRALGVADDDDKALDAAYRAIEAVEKIIESLELPQTLAQIGISEDKIADIAAQSLNSTRLIDNNPRPLDIDALMLIATAAYHGDRTIGLSSVAAANKAKTSTP